MSDIASTSGTPLLGSADVIARRSAPAATALRSWRGPPCRHDERGDLGIRTPSRELGGELFPTVGGKSIVLGPPTGVRVAPLSLEPALVFHAMEGRIERTLLHLQALPGGTLDPLEHSQPVHRSPRQRLE